jgi:hypothetical protein
MLTSLQYKCVNKQTESESKGFSKSEIFRLRLQRNPRTRTRARTSEKLCCLSRFCFEMTRPHMATGQLLGVGSLAKIVRHHLTCTIFFTIFFLHILVIYTTGCPITNGIHCKKSVKTKCQFKKNGLEEKNVKRNVNKLHFCRWLVV